MANTEKPEQDNDIELEVDTTLTKESDLSADNIAETLKGDVPDAETSVEQTDDQGSPSESEATLDVPETMPNEPARRGGFAPALIGGILAACLGFLAARTEVLDPILPDSLKSNGAGDVIAALQVSDNNQAEALTALRSEIAAIDQPDLGPVNEQLASVQAELSSLKTDSKSQQARLEDIEAHLNPLNARLDELEKRPMTEGASDTAVAAYDRELAALREATAAQRAEVEKMIDEARATEAAARALEQSAASAARHAQNQAAVTRLYAALDNGAAYAAILAELDAAGIAVPDVLNASANDGITTLTALNDAFPISARSALSAARAEDGSGGGLVGFLQRQTGARSVQPRDGDDPDAILSRAEAAVTDGDLAKALEEIATLPDAARAAMQDWVDISTTRLAALKAAEELAQSLNTN